jgi:hypothetical protein
MDSLHLPEVLLTSVSVIAFAASAAAVAPKNRARFKEWPSGTEST